MIKIFMDGPRTSQVKESRHLVQGFTTNPTLMRQQGAKDYEFYAKRILEDAEGLPVSLEVFADDYYNMVRQGLKISSWSPNVWVKVPICNTGGEIMTSTIGHLLREGVSVNVTAVMSKRHIAHLEQFASDRLIVSVFAGRIADTGRDPVPLIQDYLSILKVPVLWASTRQILDVVHAERAGCKIITMPFDMIQKMLKLKDRDLDDYSIETSQMFYNDASQAGYQL
jgi:transaldolase